MNAPCIIYLNHLVYHYFYLVLGECNLFLDHRSTAYGVSWKLAICPLA